MTLESVKHNVIWQMKHVWMASSFGWGIFAWLFHTWTRHGFVYVIKGEHVVTIVLRTLVFRVVIYRLRGWFWGRGGLSFCSGAKRNAKGQFSGQISKVLQKKLKIRKMTDLLWAPFGLLWAPWTTGAFQLCCSSKQRAAMAPETNETRNEVAWASGKPSGHAWVN